ncbi:MAG: hydroxyethylthiazole kinase [Hyphomicrobiales bacterium]
MSAKISQEKICPQTIGDCLSRLRERRPLVHNITNFVVMNFTANILLALGASPAMVHAAEEVEDFTAISAALVVNIGTLDASWVKNMSLAARKAAAAGIPWVLDPVGAGATPFRTRTALAILALAPNALRGNASEILAVTGAAGHMPKGVDATVSSAHALEAARSLARQTRTVVAVTGATDYVVGAERGVALRGGSPMSQLVTGTGCAATACVGAFLAVEKDALLATAAGLAALKAAAAMAEPRAEGPGSFQTALLDALYRLSPEDLAKHVAIGEA